MFVGSIYYNLFFLVFTAIILIILLRIILNNHLIRLPRFDHNWYEKHFLSRHSIDKLDLYHFLDRNKSFQLLIHSRS